MGEYVKYKGNDIKIGTMYNLYYVTYEKYSKAFDAGLLSRSDYSSDPALYLKPEHEFGYRFPFPDEKKLPFGEIGRNDFNRGIPVKLDVGLIPLPESWKTEDGVCNLELCQQYLIHREPDGQLCLAPALRGPELGNAIILNTESEIQTLVSQIETHHILENADQESKSFYQEISVQLSHDFKIFEKQLQHTAGILRSPRKVLTDSFKRKGKGI
ncbi:hypothetical protein [Niabella beijingensis]|uniref:hypothetical protein n=1 Tax=Niabella beijingensis TaxID=2872700 RepID=UPI001CBE8552|nr:hypothetical protein [Niabella beijingensis]MBZ4188892.1 hypothetical protein [Niabella beijingensis]